MLIIYSSHSRARQVVVLNPPPGATIYGEGQDYQKGARHYRITLAGNSLGKAQMSVLVGTYAIEGLAGT